MFPVFSFLCDMAFGIVNLFCKYLMPYPMGKVA